MQARLRSADPLIREVPHDHKCVIVGAGSGKYAHICTGLVQWGLGGAALANAGARRRVR